MEAEDPGAPGRRREADAELELGSGPQLLVLRNVLETFSGAVGIADDSSTLPIELAEVDELARNELPQSFEHFGRERGRTGDGLGLA